MLDKAFIVWNAPNDVVLKTQETAYFAYFSRRLGGTSYLVMRKMKDGGYFKPYAILNAQMFNEKRHLVKRERPPQ